MLAAIIDVKHLVQVFGYPLLFLIAVLALVVFMSGRRGVA